MAKQFKDFMFANKKLGDFGDYITVDFNSGDSEIVLGMSREMEIGSTNTYRIEANYYGDKWSDVLPIEIHLIKNPCIYHTQSSLRFSKNEIRQLTRWLTSPHFPQWIHFEYCDDDDNEVANYKGWFNNIETWCVGGEVYGLKLFFSCTTPFGYTDDISSTYVLNSDYKNITINNDSDELNSYCYPRVTIVPNDNTGIYICNLSDCEIVESGQLILSSSTYFESLCDKIEDYAMLQGCKLIYAGNMDDTVVALCDDTAVQFYLVDKYGVETKCSAFYVTNTLNNIRQYWIVIGGFMFLEAKRDLSIYMDCQKLLITDSIGRMVTYDDLGIADVDNMYWLRLVNGDNTIILYGNASFTITHKESRKVGE